MATLSIRTVRVVPFSEEECTFSPTSGPPLFSWREYYGFRNRLLDVLRPYGTVGPMGALPILDTWEGSKKNWPRETWDPDFFVIGDMWNEWNRWNRVEASARLVNKDLLVAIVHMLDAFPGWCVYMALSLGGLTLFGDRILCEGGLFRGAGSIDELGARCQSIENG